MQGGEAEFILQAAPAARQLLGRPINLLSLSKMKVKLAVGALPGLGHPCALRLALEEIVPCPGRIRQEGDTIRFLFRPCCTKYCPLHICPAV